MLEQLPAASVHAPVAVAARAQCLSSELGQSLLTLRSRDGRLSAVVAPSLGGALVGLQWRRGGQTSELLHRGMNFCPTQDFDGKAPILWPATGRTYLSATDATPRFGWHWQGRDYAMPLHGFARDRAWRVVRGGGEAREIVLWLDDDAASRAIYPFRFGMTAAYRLSGRTLTIRYRVTAGRNPTAMPFSIGNHITFALPLGGVGNARETRLSTAPRARILLDAAGRPTVSIRARPRRAASCNQSGVTDYLSTLHVRMS